MSASIAATRFCSFFCGRIMIKYMKATMTTIYKIITIPPPAAATGSAVNKNPI
jgi:hypothetical protein